MSETKEKTAVSIEDTLLRQLRHGGIEKERLKELVAVVAGLQKDGLKQLKVFPKGIPPVVDCVRVSGVVQAAEAGRIIGDIVTKTEFLGNIELFPIGIPWPELLVVNLDIGSPVETGEVNRF
jgi:hypothetical protein